MILAPSLFPARSWYNDTNVSKTSLSSLGTFSCDCLPCKVNRRNYGNWFLKPGISLQVFHFWVWEVGSPSSSYLLLVWVISQRSIQFWHKFPSTSYFSSQWTTPTHRGGNEPFPFNNTASPRCWKLLRRPLSTGKRRISFSNYEDSDSNTMLLHWTCSQRKGRIKEETVRRKGLLALMGKKQTNKLQL